MHRATCTLCICVFALLSSILALSTSGDAGLEDEPPGIIIPKVFEVEVGQILVISIPDEVLRYLSPGNCTYRDDNRLIETDPITGIVTWDAPTRDHVGEHFITLIVTDGEGRSDQHEIKVRVVPPAGLPVIGMIPPLVATQDTLFTYQVPIDEHFSDEEFTFTNTHHRLFTVDNRTGLIQFTPGNRHVGQWDVLLIVTGPLGLTVEIMINITVLNVNDLPVLAPVPYQVLTEDVPFDISLYAHDPDMESRLNDQGTPVDPEERITFRTNLPAGPTFEVDGSIVYVPTEEDADRGQVVAHFDVRDRSGSGAERDAVFAIVDVYDPPRLQIVGLVEGQRIRMGTKVVLRVDVEGGDWDPAMPHSVLWYSGTTFIGSGNRIEWTVDGRGFTTVKVELQDLEERKVDEVMNVMITGEICTGEWGFNGTGTCLALIPFVCVLVPLVVVLRIARGGQHRAGSRDGMARKDSRRP